MAEAPALPNLLAFPDFQSCPTEYDIDERYYATDGGAYSKIRDWCLLAEITRVDTPIRLRLTVRDRAGSECFVAFYLDNDEDLEIERYRKGRTIAILYPHQRTFLDGTQGVRQEEKHNVQVIPLPLSDVLKIVDTKNVQPACCQVCEKPKESLFKCGRCRRRWYCDKECQQKDWTQENHKARCKGFSMAQRLAAQDWESSVDYHRFPL